MPGVYCDSVYYLQSRGYKLGKSIGEGSYCKVKTATKTYSNGVTKKIACKMIDKRKASNEFVNKFLPRELSIVKNIKHPNIVSVSDIIDSHDYVYLFMDICEKGDLLDYIRNKGALSEAKAKVFFRQIVSAIYYLHTLDISHRDLKCENILLASKDCVKLGDFGFARCCRDAGTQRRILSETFCGSAAYAAPEILKGTPYNPKMYDVWSLGCILFIMLTGAMPFDDSNIQEMLKVQTGKILPFPPKYSISKSAKDLIMHMLEPDITKRATISQISQSNWLKEIPKPEHFHFDFILSQYRSCPKRS
uniref:Protein kinase domain-containing protein n=1 Tax=Clastoptera arizonana TaxID=38151 RepID=A0A1B6C4E2_9HEMI